MSTERAKATKAEVQRLLDTSVIRPVQYPEWLANVVIVRKKNGKWRMCVDFIDWNKHCPKDPNPLPRIDKLVDIAAGCEMMSLLDCFSGYHQIWLNPEDEEKTSFITPGKTKNSSTKILAQETQFSFIIRTSKGSYSRIGMKLSS